MGKRSGMGKWLRKMKASEGRWARPRPEGQRGGRGSEVDKAGPYSPQIPACGPRDNGEPQRVCEQGKDTVLIHELHKSLQGWRGLPWGLSLDARDLGGDRRGTEGRGWGEIQESPETQS